MHVPDVLQVEAEDLLKYPQLYMDKESFSASLFWQWAGMGLLHSLPIFFFPFFILMSTFENQSFWSGSVVVYHTLVFVGMLISVHTFSICRSLTLIVDC